MNTVTHYIRMSEFDKKQFIELKKVTGKSVSRLIGEAVALLIEHYKNSICLSCGQQKGIQK